ncbi:DNA topoisomerase 1 [Yamadazyma tenuis]|uniref:DNA topoisomerase I n=1 Tax=Candida tenuis (strain ATCC 10573 / BCRC 21748 / CBS 615 / JCM 9827 / NBRC 10315 / NRRL Y-1498 / VKM Y-70) TaxID=590646 RepID=G3B1F3_CANTC|nr:uncharacterized protein CANTEDRAFT_121194 [Yamadazyma tenuis ATCC 10573]EGV64959.1 hypothetical protein CANTEDRAFT_121194 [Yamadazyma tenuis ATCC 10573]WEJ97754.1 DNA topoisomerase 1 [Yamadazyma tenuis]
MSSSEDDIPIVQRSKRILDDSEDDVPISQLPSSVKKKVKRETDDSVSLNHPKSKSSNGTSKSSSNGNIKTPKKERTKKTPSDKKKPNKSLQVKSEDKPTKQEEDEEETEETYKWWEEQEDRDGEIKWDSLVHNGVLFPPEYEPLPSHVKLYYNGTPVNLPQEAEEVAGFFGALVETDHGKNPVFQSNFFKDFQQVLKECGGCNVEIEKFEHLDFSKMYAHFEQLKEDKKKMSKEEKREIKEDKERQEEPYRTCLLNGRKEKIGNFRIEPPGLFRGRGAHPKTGRLKRRVFPEDVTLNLSEGAPVPPPPEGHSWGDVKHDNTVTWLAMWKENIADSFKYVRFAQNSSVKGLSDFKKFETARNLKHHIESIRKDYTQSLKSELMQERQMATATYLIDIFALRAGGEKGDDEADTVGCCSLRYEHVTLRPPNTVIFDFLGKDSIRFYQEVEVDKQVFKNLKIFKKPPKQPGDDLFDRISPPLLNKKFQTYMKGLTAKVFRTYNASKTMQDQLDLIKNEGTVAEKVVRFNAANRTVAILCNHQRTVSKSHGNSVQKINDKLRELMWNKIRLKQMMLELDPKLKRKDPKYFAEIEDLSKEDIMVIQEKILERTKEQVAKKFERDNEKLKAESKDQLTANDLKERMQKVKELQAEFKIELASGKPEIKKSVTVEKLKSQVEQIEQRILNTQFQLKDKEDNSEVSLGTSKMNYIDPRLTVVFSKRFDVPIEKLFTKTLREKFTWAIESADKDWRF